MAGAVRISRSGRRDGARPQNEGTGEIRNLIALLGMMWSQAKAWGYVQHDPFWGLVLPERDPPNERCLMLEEMIPHLELALEGKMEEHHRFLLKVQLHRLQAAEEDLAILEQRLQENLEPYATQLTLLDEIVGVDWTLAAVIIAELGVDMSVFQSVSQLASWAGVCPGNNESAGKRKSSRIPKGNVHLKTALSGSCPLSSESQGYLPAGQVFPSQSPARVQAGCGGHRPQDSSRHLAQDYNSPGAGVPPTIQAAGRLRKGRSGLGFRGWQPRRMRLAVGVRSAEPIFVTVIVHFQVVGHLLAAFAVT